MKALVRSLITRAPQVMGASVVVIIVLVLASSFTGHQWPLVIASVPGAVLAWLILWRKTVPTDRRPW